MKTNEVIVFYICILTPLYMHLMNLVFGCQHDCYFSDSTIKKLVVPKKSFLRKLVIFKENKMTNPQFLYIRVIPYLFQLFITIYYFLNYSLEHQELDSSAVAVEHPHSMEYLCYLLVLPLLVADPFGIFSLLYAYSKEQAASYLGTSPYQGSIQGDDYMRILF